MASAAYKLCSQENPKEQRALQDPGPHLTSPQREEATVAYRASWYWRELGPRIQLLSLQRFFFIDWDQLIYWNFRWQGFTLVAGWIPPFAIHFTGYTHEILSLTRSELIRVRLFGFWSLSQMQALEEITKHKCWEESKNYSHVHHQLLIYWKVTAAVPVFEGSNICAQRQCSKRIRVCNTLTYSELLDHIFSVIFSAPGMSLHWVTGRTCSASPQFHLPQKPPCQCDALSKGACSWWLLRAQQTAEPKCLLYSGI